MGPWDTYCAICGVVAQDHISENHISSNDSITLSIGRKKATAIKETRKKCNESRFHVYFGSGDGYDLDEAKEGWDWEKEQGRYDRDHVGDLGWLDDVQCLAFDSNGGR
ncbi:hypothetical protein J3459_017030 [Metarhizium acridum]|uniref:uncharacterized protein n=1 Tax=Metarhizium acridum TaxID=92637 RepID=UPI001C6B097C|nr:hypothetical protein J3459_017030 [Metarhizium acridum]KAG8411657.1 hypothetical protein J3458_015716 [Metarhizium acridum]